MKPTTLLSLACMAVLFSCSKGGDSKPTDSQPNYIGRWSLVNKVNWHTTNGVLHKDTIPGKPGEYIEFKVDGTVTESFYVNSQFTYSTFSYSVANGGLTCDDFPPESKISVSNNALTIDASEPSNVESLWWHYKK